MCSQCVSLIDVSSSTKLLASAACGSVLGLAVELKSKSVFSNGLQSAYSFLCEVTGNKNMVLCTHFNSTFSLAHGGLADIKKYILTAKHKLWLQAGSN
jgi:hypothetical protein